MCRAWKRERKGGSNGLPGKGGQGTPRATTLGGLRSMCSRKSCRMSGYVWLRNTQYKDYKAPRLKKCSAKSSMQCFDVLIVNLPSLVGISKDLHGPQGLWGSQREASCWILHVFEKHWNRWATSTVLCAFQGGHCSFVRTLLIFVVRVLFFIFILHEQGNSEYHNGTWGSRD